MAAGFIFYYMPIDYMVIPDQHGRDKWHPPALAHLQTGGSVICLGDYCDAFLLTDQQILDNFLDVILLKEAYPEQVTLLLGNHDFSYINRQWACSGNRPSMYPYLNILFRKNSHLFQLAHQVGNTLFVHAGLTKEWLSYNRMLIEGQLRYDAVLTANGLPTTIEGFLQQYTHADLLNRIWQSVERQLLWQVSRTHGGYDYYDSPVWVRPSQLLNSLPEGLNQVVGHTNMKHVAVSQEPSIGSAVTFTDTMANTGWEPLILSL